jgi:F-type H+-transporting ATPase subunit delta
MSARFARPYADALIEIAHAGADFEAITAGLSAIAQGLASSGPLRAVLGNPAIERQSKESVLRALSKRVGLPEVAIRLLLVLAHNGRILELAEVVDALREALDERNGVVPAHVTVASPIGANERSAIERALGRITGKTVRLTVDVDPGILAGFVARVGSERIDASAAGAIEGFKEEAIQNARV